MGKLWYADQDPYRETLYQISAEHEGAKLGALLRIAEAAPERAHTNHIHANRGASFAHIACMGGGPESIQADAIANYSHLFRKSEGLYLSFPNQNSIAEDFIEHTKGREIDLIVCSDSEAILGIGDQGVGVSRTRSLLVRVISNAFSRASGWVPKCL